MTTVSNVGGALFLCCTFPLAMILVGMVIEGHMAWTDWHLRGAWLSVLVSLMMVVFGLALSKDTRRILMLCERQLWILKTMLSMTLPMAMGGVAIGMVLGNTSIPVGAMLILLGAQVLVFVRMLHKEEKDLLKVLGVSVITAVSSYFIVGELLVDPEPGTWEKDALIMGLLPAMVLFTWAYHFVASVTILRPAEPKTTSDA